MFDTKGDFWENFHLPGDLVVGNGKKYREISARWNLFDDVLADGDNLEDYEINAREMAAALFEGRGSDSQPFSRMQPGIFLLMWLFILFVEQKKIPTDVRIC